MSVLLKLNREPVLSCLQEQKHVQKPFAASHHTSAPDPAGTGLAPVGDDCMWIDGRFAGLLQSAGLDRFASVMETRDGDCMRALADRENWRLRLDGQTVYLKKHHIRTPKTRLRAKLGRDPGETAARTEARNVRHLTRDGIDCMTLIAFGERLAADGLLESFLLSEDLRGYTQLDHFIAERFSQREFNRTQVFRNIQNDSSDSTAGQAISGTHPDGCCKALVRDKKESQDIKALIEAVAQVARRFHQAGYNHRDLYCCHFFIREPEPGSFDVRLIDLQRVQHRRRFRRRWIVKDLAQLAYSAPRDRIKCTHKMAFVRSYLGVRKLRPRDKRLIRAVLAKQQLMELKQGIIP